MVFNWDQFAQFWPVKVESRDHYSLALNLFVLIYNRTILSHEQVVKIDGRIVGDGRVGAITQRLQNSYKNLAKDSGVPIPTYHKS